MDEPEWLDCTDPNRMLRSVRGKATVRKLRLFGCACVRRIWELFSHDKDALPVVELVERYADDAKDRGESYARTVEDMRAYFGRPDEEELAETAPQKGEDDTPLAILISQANAAYAVFLVRESAYRLPECVFVNRYAEVESKVRQAAKYVVFAVLGATAPAKANAKVKQEVKKTERTKQCQVLHDIIGTFFRPVSLAPPWRTPSVVSLAQAAYEERTLPAGTLDPDRLAVLSDALDEAGCTDTDILSHLRGPGPHVRGCWVIDLLLGKE
jgi:hypothetical protein